MLKRPRLNDANQQLIRVSYFLFAPLPECENQFVQMHDKTWLRARN
jgi:hypothetical protein